MHLQTLPRYFPHEVEETENEPYPTNAEVEEVLWHLYDLDVSVDTFAINGSNILLITTFDAFNEIWNDRIKRREVRKMLIEYYDGVCIYRRDLPDPFDVL